MSAPVKPKCIAAVNVYGFPLTLPCESISLYGKHGDGAGRCVESKPDCRHHDPVYAEVPDAMRELEAAVSELEREAPHLGDELRVAISNVRSALNRLNGPTSQP